jgi:carbamoyl-phosphate synthase large subunit
MNILFTCAGRRNYLINYFREALGNKGIIVCADSNPSAPAMAVADKAFVVPTIYEPNYIESILDICNAEKIKGIISLNDLELPLLTFARDRFQKAGVTLVLSSDRVIDICFDKWKTYEFAVSHNIKTPNTYLTLAQAKTAIRNQELTFPLVVKPRWGSASIGITFPQDMEELDLAYRLSSIRLSRTILAEVSKNDMEKAILIQEKIDGTEYGLDVLNDFECKTRQVFVKEKLAMRAGETDKSVLRNNPDLEAMGFKIGESLGHIGNLDCDVFEKDGQYFMLELNPRFGGGYPFSQMSGARYPDAIIAWLEGIRYDFGKTKKTYEVIYAKCDTLIDVSVGHRDKSGTQDLNNSICKNSIEIIQSSNAEKWHDIVTTSYQYDFYHTLEYHLIAEKKGEGRPILFVYQDSSNRIALPLLLRPIQHEVWFPPGHHDIFDVTSVYGYTGPIASHRDLSAEFLKQFSCSLINALREMNVVSLFSRLHPLINFGLCFDDYFRRRMIGETISIDLTIPSEVQQSLYRTSHRQEIKRLRKAGFYCLEDTGLNYLDDFVRIYHDTMSRVDASAEYFFDKEHFENLLKNMNNTMHLFVCMLNQEVTCAGIFSLCSGIIQYHLCGSSYKFRKEAPMKLLLDYVRDWGIEHGSHTFHLGGGVGSKRDSLFDFKAGFSDRKHTFAVWEKILLPEEYKLLCDAKADYNRINNLQNSNESFFPLYRSNAEKIVP